MARVGPTVDPTWKDPKVRTVKPLEFDEGNGPCRPVETEYGKYPECDEG